MDFGKSFPVSMRYVGFKPRLGSVSLCVRWVFLSPYVDACAYTHTHTLNRYLLQHRLFVAYTVSMAAVRLYLDTLLAYTHVAGYMKHSWRLSMSRVIGTSTIIFVASICFRTVHL